MRVQEDLLYKKVRSTLTIANSNIKIARYLINFVVNLPNSNRFTNIIVVINRFIKMRHIIPIDLINIILVAKCFIKHVFKLYRLSNLIISDRKSQFILDFQQALYKQLSI